MSAHNDGGPVDVLAITREMRARLVNKRMSPTLIAWADRIDAAVAALIAERDALAQELERLQADGVHSCGPHCQRIACVLGRERDALREALKSLRGVVPYFWHDDSPHIGELDEACEAADNALALTTGESA